MSSPGKITFGNNPATSYTLNNANFGYATGENMTTSYSPYTGGPTTVNPQPLASYSSYQGGDKLSYGGPTSANLSTYGTTNQYNSASGIPTRDVPYTAATNPKITFGSKQYTSSYNPQPQYTPTYAPPASQFQPYETYRQPVQIITQPIRQETRVEQRIQPAKVSNKGSKVGAVAQQTAISPAVQESIIKKKKKGGCPTWLWPLLGILALLALILGLLFGLGVFGRGATPPVTNGATTSTSAGTTAGTAAIADTAAGATTGTTGTTATTQPTGYTVIEETVILSKNNTTPITTPTPSPTFPVITPAKPNVTVTTPTVTPTPTPTPTITPVTPVTPATPTPVTTTPTVTPTATDQDFFSPQGLQASPVGPTDYTPQPTYTTYPSYDTTGYGSNPTAAGSDYYAVPTSA